MPHDKIAELSGNHHVCRSKESPFEHNPHAYTRSQEGIDDAAKKTERLVRRA